MSDSAERAEFPPDVLGEILIRAGAWSPAEQGPAAAAAAARPRMCAWSICPSWRNCLRGPPPDHLAKLLLEVHGPDQALMHALHCTSTAVDRCDLIRAVLRLPGVRADCEDGAALVQASARGCEAVVCLLLGWGEHAPRANCQDGEALVRAARGGHEAVLQLLLEWGEHAPRADCQDSAALVRAAGGGHEAVVCLLLGWGEHAPRADCQGGLPFTYASAGGHVQVMRCLQEAMNNPPAVP